MTENIIHGDSESRKLGMEKLKQLPCGDWIEKAALSERPTNNFVDLICRGEFKRGKRSTDDWSAECDGRDLLLGSTSC
jgi:hypothetical protein